MVKRRSGDLDSSLLRRGGVRGKHLAHQFALPGNDEGLILQRISLTFLDQRRDIRIFKKELIKPCDLREHLQIGKILRLKIFVGPLRRIAGAVEIAPKAPDSADTAQSYVPGSPEKDIAARSGVRRA